LLCGETQTAGALRHPAEEAWDIEESGTLDSRFLLSTRCLRQSQPLRLSSGNPDDDLLLNLSPAPRHKTTQYILATAGAHGAISMSARARFRDAKKHKVPFCTIHQDVMLNASIRMPGNAVRIFWLANASWVPVKTAPGAGVVVGKAVLPISRLRNPLGLKRAECSVGTPGSDSIRNGINACVEAGVMIKKSPGTRPGGPGVPGKAAEYDLPHRHSVNVPRVQLLPNVRRPEGKVVQISELVRVAMAILPDPAVRVFTYAVCFRDRCAGGAVKAAAPFPLPVRHLAGLLEMATSTVGDALGLLVKQKLLCIDQPGAGRRPTTYRLHSRWASFGKTGPD